MMYSYAFDFVLCIDYHAISSPSTENSDFYHSLNVILHPASLYLDHLNWDTLVDNKLEAIIGV